MTAITFITAIQKLVSCLHNSTGDSAVETAVRKTFFLAQAMSLGCPSSWQYFLEFYSSTEQKAGHQHSLTSNYFSFLWTLPDQPPY
jgi:hypothetical protein